MGDAVGSDVRGSEFLGLSMKVEVSDGEPDLVIYVVRSSQRVLATMLLSVAWGGLENGSPSKGPELPALADQLLCQWCVDCYKIYDNVGPGALRNR